MPTLCPKPDPRPGERWTHVHEPTPIHPDNVPDEDCDVFEAVAAIENERLENFNLNLNGKQIMNHPQTALASALTSAGVTHLVTGHNYFDPLDTLDSKLGIHSALHSRVMSSLAWLLDMAVINAARTVLFARYGELELHGEEEFNSFCQGIGEDLAHESLYADDTNELLLAQLIALRPKWHDAAQAAQAADERDYNPKDIHQMLLDEKPRKTSIGTRMNLELIAEKMAKGDEAKKQRMLAAMIERDEIQAKERAAGNKRLVPTIMTIINTASRFAPADIRFDQLPLAMQKRLTQYVLDTIERAQMDVAKLSKIPPITFALIVDAAFDTIEALNKVMAERYSDKGELENAYAGMPPAVDAFERRQREIARAE